MICLKGVLCMENLREVLKEALYERAARLSVQAQKKDLEWTVCEQAYGEFLEALQKVGLVDQAETVFGSLRVQETEYFYWQGLLDGTALLRLLSEK